MNCQTYQGLTDSNNPGQQLWKSLRELQIPTVMCLHYYSPAKLAHASIAPSLTPPSVLGYIHTYRVDRKCMHLCKNHINVVQTMPS